ncbi:MAG: 8-oxoguanine DNA glycosylase [Epulopiscium sp. Nele67-Bin002]|nr:MAG: 8-oxoguanine DNA glycosylase [Epulopiscium sp. Nuni2H_MBin001]OON92156.1 MAG: 8-oxoguanine DNA glycosylase [Epulopiscium sp. Nele67-Bin002]
MEQLNNLKHFNIAQVLECGQVFRFNKDKHNDFILVAGNKKIKICQQADSIIIKNSTPEDISKVWKTYFDLDTNYEDITNILMNKDEHMSKIVQFGEGIRILRQDPWEMLISFIISQNKAIPHIKTCIENICLNYGTPIDSLTHAFPTVNQLMNVTDEQLRECKVGFRAGYIIDATKKVFNGEIDLENIKTMGINEARIELMKIKGVGPKIADCILLFAYNKMDVFPTDVWIKRMIEGLYFNGQDTKLDKIQKFAKEYFGELAGYAQQYLFFYGRENGMFKK